MKAAVAGIVALVAAGAGAGATELIRSLQTECGGPSCASSPSSKSDRAAPEPECRVACKLTAEELKQQREELLPGLLRRAETIVDLVDGLRLQFPNERGLLAELARVIEREQGCCSFLRFRITVDPEEGPIALEVTGPPGTREMLRKL